MKYLMFSHNNRIEQVGPIIVASPVGPLTRRRVNTVPELLKYHMQGTELDLVCNLVDAGPIRWLVEDRKTKQYRGFYQIVECGDPL